jgi:3-oxosteroid 1-dehydrogenase
MLKTTPSHTNKTPFDHEVDVLIVGSGNGAMTAAICAKDLLEKQNGGNAEVLLVEKSNRFGGTSALSGGGVWVPNNRYAKAAGAEDSYDEALAYLNATIPEQSVKRSMLETYLKHAPEMIDYLHQHTRVRYRSLAKYPDYFSDVPGAKNGHRSMEPEAISFTALGKDMDKMLEGGVMYVMYKYGLTQAEAQVLVAKRFGWQLMMARLVLPTLLDIPWKLRGKRFSRRTCGGGAGIIRLFLSLRDRQIPLWLESPFQELIMEDGKVIGAEILKEGQRYRIRARKGVILAAGGFEHNQQMREQYLPKPTNTEWSAGCKTNTGDAIRAAIDIGAKTGLMDNAWWCTTKLIPDRPYPFLSIVSKSLPGSIVVNQTGERFSNESQNYMSFLKETFAKHQQGNPCVPCYMIFDESFRKKNNVWPAVLPDSMIPRSYYDEGLMAKGQSISELAEKIGIDAEGLEQTVRRFNDYASKGKDPDFNRGDAAYDRYYGDPDVKPNPCLGPILEAPFTAIKLHPGDFGTQGGMVINENAQVCDNNDQVIEGLYACGNCSAAVLPTYPGPGSTLGPAMTFAFQAAKHIAGVK